MLVVVKIRIACGTAAATQVGAMTRQRAAKCGPSSTKSRPLRVRPGRQSTGPARGAPGRIHVAVEPQAIVALEAVIVCALAFMGYPHERHKAARTPARSSRFRTLPLGFRGRLSRHTTADALLLAQAHVGPFVQLGLSDSRSGMRHHHGQRGLAPALARQSDHGHLGDRRVLAHNDLDIGWIDVLAARNDHVLLAVDHVEKPLCIEPTEIAGAQPLRPAGSTQVASRFASSCA